MHSYLYLLSPFCINWQTLHTLPLVGSASEIAGVNADFAPKVSKTELQHSTQIAASLFFQKVFGSSGAVRGLNFLIALSAFGNLLAVLLGQSRVIRECGRYLPANFLQ